MSIGSIGSLQSSLSSLDAQPSFVRARFHARHDEADRYTPQTQPTARSGAGSVANYTSKPSTALQTSSYPLIPSESKGSKIGPKPLPPEAVERASTKPPVAPPVPLPAQRVDSEIGRAHV